TVLNIFSANSNSFVCMSFFSFINYVYFKQFITFSKGQLKLPLLRLYEPLFFLLVNQIVKVYSFKWPLINSDKSTSISLHSFSQLLNSALLHSFLSAWRAFSCFFIGPVKSSDSFL